MVSGAGQLFEAPREGCGLPEARLLEEGNQMSNDKPWQDMTPDEQAVAIRQISGAGNGLQFRVQDLKDVVKALHGGWTSAGTEGVPSRASLRGCSPISSRVRPRRRLSPCVPYAAVSRPRRTGTNRRSKRFRYGSNKRQEKEFPRQCPLKKHLKSPRCSKADNSTRASPA